MNKILTLALAMSLVASAGFAGGVKESALKYSKPGPTVTLDNNVPPVVFLTAGAVGAAVVAGVLGGSGSSTSTTATTQSGS